MVACAGAASARAAAARERARNRMLGSSTLVDQAQRTPERLVELLDLVGLGRIGDAFEERGRRGLVARALQRVAITPQVGARVLAAALADQSDHPQVGVPAELPGAVGEHARQYATQALRIDQ